MSRTTKACQFAIVSFLVTVGLLTSPTHALKINIKKAVSDIGNIGKQIVKLPNPITTPIQILTGNQNPLHVKDYLKQQGQAVSAIAASTRNISNIPYDVAGQAISDVGGDKALIVFEFATGAERFQREFAFTATQQVAAVLQGQDPLIAIAMPLASAIRDAHSKFAAQAQPFPSEVKKLLGLVVPPDILERARYTVGDVKISLPTAIKGVNAFLGAVTGDHEKFSKDIAVTLDDIVVFPRQLDFNDIDDLVWTGHELFHVKQYRDWGIDQFAFNYLKNHNAVEDQAVAAESYIRSFLMQVANNQPINPRITYTSSSAYATKAIQTPLGSTIVMTKSDEANNAPGNLQNNGVLQPVFNNAVNSGYSAYCVINGESLFIAKDDTIIAPMRGFMPFGKRFKPGLSPMCYFDLQFPAIRACAQEITSVDPRTNQTLYGYDVYLASNYAGRCASCTPETCPQ